VEGDYRRVFHESDTIAGCAESEGGTGTAWNFLGIARQKPALDDMRMNSKTRRPRIGDQVGIAGFLGRFEVVQVGLNGAMTDLKHLGVPGPDYIERDILSHELIYLNAQKLDGRLQACSPNE
jgi:hypothetical protein